MFERIKSIFAPRARTVFKAVKARFDSAQTTKDNARHWSAADALSADGEASPEVRRTLRMRSRYEIANNSYARGLVQMLANDTIGTGPRLQMLTDDEAFNDEAEAAFAKWSEAVMLPQKLRTMRMARCQDGEAFAVLDTNPGIRHTVKLGLTLIEADRVSGEPRWMEADGEVDGIRFDQWGNPESYRVLKRHPGDAFAMPGDEAVIVPAVNMVHIFRRDRPGLHRGIPELTPALDLFAQLRRYSKAVLSAAEAAADFAAVLYTDAPPDGESEDIEALDTIPLERNMMVTMPAGWKMGQLDPKQPSSTHSEAVKCYLSEIARCVSCTYGTVAGDFSGFNYASGRLDSQVYHKSILVDRSCWEGEVLNRVFEAWFREWLLLRGEAEADDSHTWFWDGFPHVDPVKEATAQSQRLASCTTTLAAECAREGRDYMAVLRQRGKELKVMRELGIPVTANGNNVPETGKEKDDE